MARPLSPEKKHAILQAAREVVAAEGSGARTATIAKKAGVAEGTLFTYFANKDALLNELYVELKADLARALAKGFPSGAGAQERCRHLWNSYIRWGAATPSKHQAIRQLGVSERVTESSREAGRESVEKYSSVLVEISPDEKRSDFTGAILTALADATLDFIAREPKRARRYTELGFDAFWHGVAGN